MNIKTLTARVARAFGNDLVLDNDELDRRLSGRTIEDMCSESVQLREDIVRLSALVSCKREELRLVDNEIIEWGEGE